MAYFNRRRMLVPDSPPQARAPKEGTIVACIGIICAAVAIAALAFLLFGA
jgi:hypothetical protein